MTKAHPEGPSIRLSKGDIVSSPLGRAMIVDIWPLVSFPYICRQMGRGRMCCGDLVWWADSDLELVAQWFPGCGWDRPEKPIR